MDVMERDVYPGSNPGWTQDKGTVDIHLVAVSISKNNTYTKPALLCIHLNALYMSSTKTCLPNLNHDT